jgi:branched-chain amino acid transport system substrate-binding protein
MDRIDPAARVASRRPAPLRALLATLALAAFAVPAHADRVVRIGVAGPYSGPVAAYGKDFENAVRLAIEDANAMDVRVQGERVRFEIVSEDDAGDPRQAVQVANRLVDQGVAGVVGHLTSSATVPAARVYGEAGIPQIAPAATNPALTREGYATAFRVIGDDLQVGAALAKYIVVTMGLGAVAVIDDRSAYGQGLADVVARVVPALGGRVVAREYTSDHASDFSAILTRLRGRGAQAIFYGGVHPQAALLKRQMRELGVDARLFGSSISSDEFIAIAGREVAEDTISADSGQAIGRMPGGAAFAARFAARYGKIVMYAPYGYDATMVLVRAIQAAGSATPSRVLPEIRRLEFAGVTGPIAFDSKGDLRSAAVTFSQVRGGAWVPLETVSGAQPAPQPPPGAARK